MESKVHCRVHKSAPLAICIQFTPFHLFHYDLFECYFHVYACVFHQFFRPKFCMQFSSPFLHLRAARPAHFIILYLITLIIFGEAYRLCSFCSCSLLLPPASCLLPPATSFLLDSNNHLRTVFSLSKKSVINNSNVVLAALVNYYENLEILGICGPTVDTS